MAAAGGIKRSLSEATTAAGLRDAEEEGLVRNWAEFEVRISAAAGRAERALCRMSRAGMLCARRRVSTAVIRLQAVLWALHMSHAVAV
jgi:hypothetical protein